MKHQSLLSTLSIMALIAGSSCSSAHAVTFTPPANGGAPSQAQGGASRGSLFIPPPNSGAPSQAQGGASRGGLFTPRANGGAPGQATGGASRGGLFTPVAGNGSPNQTSGGASRADLFKPNAGNGSPNQTSGGASRADLFTPVAGNGSPHQAGGGASRADLFTPVAGNGSPEQSGGGASRVGAYPLNSPVVGMTGPAALIALLPQSAYGTTMSERPTFFVYLPASNAQEAVFSLKDEAGDLLYQMTLPAAGKTGVVAISLPANAPALEIGKNYQWLLALKLDGSLEPRTPYVDGWVQRIQPSAELASAMQQHDALKRATALGKDGVWYDCLATLATLHAAQPSNPTLTQHWQELLVSVDLKGIEAAPVSVSAY